MIKAVLRYTDCLQDGRNVYTVLTNNKVAIVGTKRSWSTYPRITIKVKNYDQLSSILHELNATCSYEVRLLRHNIIKEK